MIKAKRKPLDEIKNLLSPYSKVLIIGCGGCVSVCLAGGQKETYLLKGDIEASYQLDKIYKTIDVTTIERQCNLRFIEELADTIDKYDCLLSMACGAGVQYVAERFPDKPVFPAINTIAIGVDIDVGVYQEKCRACGECVLGYTGGICPVTRCAKGLFNGPCGGTNKGKCEISNEIPCAWYEIYNRLEKQNRLDLIMDVKMPMLWKNQTPRMIVQDDYADRYTEKAA